jgi:hypothetical protein
MPPTVAFSIVLAILVATATGRWHPRPPRRPDQPMTPLQAALWAMRVAVILLGVACALVAVVVCAVTIAAYLAS